jgi:hypothetical protein
VWFAFLVNPMFNDAIGWMMWKLGKRKRVQWVAMFTVSGPLNEWNAPKGGHILGTKTTPIYAGSALVNQCVYIKPENLKKVLAALDAAKAKVQIHDLKVD